MPAASLTARERLTLCDLFEAVGPDAPTLCTGWATRDLAAHLYVRENDPVAALGIPMAGWPRRVNERAMERTRRRGYHWTIDRLRTGPPWGPMRLPVVDRANLMEWFVHHEDVRRAGGRPPRTGIDELDEALWTFLRSRIHGVITRRLTDIGLELRRPDGASISLRTGHPVVRMVGRPSEILLFLSGRPHHAEVELQGDPSGVERLHAAKLAV